MNDPAGSSLSYSTITSGQPLPWSPRTHQANLQQVFAGAAVGFALTTLEGRFVEVNPAYCEITGYSPEELSRMTFAQIIHPEDLEAFHLLIQQMLAGEIPNFVVQNRCLSKFGTTVWVQKSVSLVRDEANRPAWIAALVEDVTKRKEQEEALRSSEAFTRRVTDIAPSILYIYDLQERRNVWGNREMTSILGYTREQIETFAGNLMAALMHPDDLERYQDYLAYLLSRVDNEAAEFEYRMRHANGTWIWLYSRDMIFARDASGQPRQIVGSALDITERKRQDEALRNARDTFEHLVENSPFGIYVVDADFRLIRVSAGAQKVFANVRPLLDRDFAEVIRIIWQEPFASKVIALFRHTLETGEPYHAPSTIEKRQDIQEIEAYDWKIERITLPDGRFGAVCHFYDLSERQQYEQEIADLNTRLQRAVAETHHRVKNNLQILSALVEMQILDDTETLPSSVLGRISQHIRTLALLHDMLTIEAKSAADRDSISLKTVLERLIPLLQTTADSRRIRTNLDEVNTTLQQSSSFVLLANEMLANAIKHGRGDVEVTLKQLPKTENIPVMARLEVCDDGPGFPPNFDPQKAANTGLELIDSLGRWDLRGQISYENRPDGGARVSLVFPLPEIAETP